MIFCFYPATEKKIILLTHLLLTIGPIYMLSKSVELSESCLGRGQELLIDHIVLQNSSFLEKASEMQNESGQIGCGGESDWHWAGE